MAAYVEPLETGSYGDQTRVMAQPLTVEGKADGPAVELSRERFARDTLIRTTPLGVVIVYTALVDLARHEIFAGAVMCHPPSEPTTQ